MEHDIFVSMCWILSVLSLCAVGLSACGCSKENSRDNRESSPEYDSPSRKSRCVCGSGLGCKGEGSLGICTLSTKELRSVANVLGHIRNTQILQFGSRIIHSRQKLIVIN
jgi:hypothetical protein